MCTCKRETRILSIIFSVILTLSFSLINVNAVDYNGEKETGSVRALKLINELAQLEMEQEGIYRRQAYISRMDIKSQERLLSINNQIEDINNQLTDLDVTLITPDTVRLSAASDYPLPPSNDKIRFYSITDYADNGEAIYILVAMPITNSTHSANQSTHWVNATNQLVSGAQTLIEIYASKLYSLYVETLIPEAGWFPYELFSGIFPTPTTGQIDMYEARLLTRTVTQFIYKKNSSGQPVYYGSTNCVHVNTEEICRAYVGSQLRSDIQNSYTLVTAENYYDFGKEIVNANLSGYAVQTKHSFVTEVNMAFAGNICLTIHPRQYTTPIQATN